MRYLKNVATLRLDEKRCTGCGMCAEVCPHAVFEITGGRIEGRDHTTAGRQIPGRKDGVGQAESGQTGQKKARIVDLDRCMECGACSMNCAFGALSVDAGVGCAAALIHRKLHGTEPSCGCGGTEKACCG